jgi:hypothetical protein
VEDLQRQLDVKLTHPFKRGFEVLIFKKGTINVNVIELRRESSPALLLTQRCDIVERPEIMT